MGLAGEGQQRHSDARKAKMRVQRIRLRDASEEDLMRLSENLGLSLNSDEMKRIQRYFSEKGRDPTDIELQSIAQAWSEHCCYKSSKSILRKFIFSTADSRCTVSYTHLTLPTKA